MWPFKKRDRNRVAAQKDITSLGNLLLKTRAITPEQLADALMYQDENPDSMLGEALIRLGHVDRGIIEAMIILQRARREGDGVQNILKLAAAETRRMVSTHQEVRLAALRLNGKS